MYITLDGNFFGGIPKMLVLCNFLKILMVSDKTIHRSFRSHATLLTKPIREIFHFHYLPKLYIGFKIMSRVTMSTFIIGAIVAGAE